MSFFFLAHPVVSRKASKEASMTLCLSSNVGIVVLLYLMMLVVVSGCDCQPFHDLTTGYSTTDMIPLTS